MGNVPNTTFYVRNVTTQFKQISTPAVSQEKKNSVVLINTSSSCSGSGSTKSNVLGQFTSFKNEVEEADRQQKLAVTNENSLGEGEAGGGLNDASELIRHEQLKNVNGGKLNEYFVYKL